MTQEQSVALINELARQDAIYHPMAPWVLGIVIVVGIVSIIFVIKNKG